MTAQENPETEPTAPPTTEAVAAALAADAETEEAKRNAAMLEAIQGIEDRNRIMLKIAEGAAEQRAALVGFDNPMVADYIALEGYQTTLRALFAPQRPQSPFASFLGGGGGPHGPGCSCPH